MPGGDEADKPACQGKGAEGGGSRGARGFTTNEEEEVLWRVGVDEHVIEEVKAIIARKLAVLAAEAKSAQAKEAEDREKATREARNRKRREKVKKKKQAARKAGGEQAGGGQGVQVRGRDGGMWGGSSLMVIAALRLTVCDVSGGGDQEPGPLGAATDVVVVQQLPSAEAAAEGDRTVVAESQEGQEPAQPLEMGQDGTEVRRPARHVGAGSCLSKRGKPLL